MLPNATLMTGVPVLEVLRCGPAGAGWMAISAPLAAPRPRRRQGGRRSAWRGALLPYAALCCCTVEVVPCRLVLLGAPLAAPSAMRTEDAVLGGVSRNSVARCSPSNAPRRETARHSLVRGGRNSWLG